MTKLTSFRAICDGSRLFRLAAVISEFNSALIFFSKSHKLLMLFLGWMSDIDMINYGFPPQRRWTGPVLYSFNGFVPSLVTGTKEAFEAVVEAFIAVSHNQSAFPDASLPFRDGTQSTSDMLIFRSRPDLYLDLKFPSSMLGPEVNKTILIHFDKAEVSRWSRITGQRAYKCDAVRLIRNISH
jgi:hypothetical protein